MNTTQPVNDWKNIIFILFILWLLYKISKSINKEGYYPEIPGIYVSLTTSPKRLPNIEHLLKSLSEQTMKPKKIILNLPYVFKRDNSVFKNIPDFIKKYPLLEINRVEDLGPSTKILGTLSLVNNPEDIIISVDDDIEYRNNMIETLFKYSQKYPDSAITGESFMRKSGNNAQLVEGYSGVLYKRKFFNNSIFEKVKNYPKFCSLADDFIISNYLLSNKISIIVANEPAENKTIVNAFLEYGNNEDALRNGAHGQSINNIDNYEKCSKYLKDKEELFIDYYIKEMYNFLL